MTEQEQTPLPSSASQQTPDPRPVTGSRAPLILSSLTLILLCGALFGGYLYSNWLTQQQSERQHKLELQLAQLQGAQPALQENTQQLQQALRNLSDNQQQLRDKQEQTEKQLLQLQSRRPNDWLLAEADYLVRM
nr:uroporphyrinogen-III C-methyltransferase [Aeromonadaceae bacterium]